MSFCENDIDGGPFYFEKALRIGERNPYTLKGKIGTTERIIGADIDIVDDFGRVITDSPAVIEVQNFGQISGVKWGATAELSLAAQDIGCCEVVWLRFSLEIDATPPLPLTRKLVRIWGVRIKR
jgi:hypothetical protein